MKRRPPRPGRLGRLPRLGRACLALAFLALFSGCDNLVKMVPIFATMVDGPVEETYETVPRPMPEGTVPVDAPVRYTLLEADTALTNPLAGTEAEIRRGQIVYEKFCVACHGPEGRGDGPVVNRDGDQPRRLPFTPAADLTQGQPLERSDGYLWGMIENGRGLMPDYRRIPLEERWFVVEYVRYLQRAAAGEAELTLPPLELQPGETVDPPLGAGLSSSEADAEAAANGGAPGVDADGADQVTDEGGS